MNPTRSLLIALLAVALFALPAVADAGQKPPPAQNLQEQINALAARVSSLEGQVSTLQTTVSTQAALITSLQTDLGAIQTSNIMALNNYLTVTTDTRGPLARFSGLNIQLVNGTGSTGYYTVADSVGPGSANGLGNLIIGYDVPRSDDKYFCSDGRYTDQATCESKNWTWAVSHKTGSHYLVIGDMNNYSRFGGLVVGHYNTSNGAYASASGGALNTASGNHATVSGGDGHIASGAYASVSGGAGNTASGTASSVSGGVDNIASGYMATVSGGRETIVAGDFDWGAAGLYQSD